MQDGSDPNHMAQPPQPVNVVQGSFSQRHKSQGVAQPKPANPWPGHDAAQKQAGRPSHLRPPDLYNDRDAIRSGHRQLNLFGHDAHPQE